MSYENEFGVVDLIINSNFETKGVDAFSLAVIKSERQVRRLFTFLVFQNPIYNESDSMNLRKVLSNNTRVYFKGFIDGINLILPHSIEDLYGVEYQNDFKNISKIVEIRNKIFHGQLTQFNLSREDLFSKTEEIKKWCNNLSIIMVNEIGYDGFERNSFHKSKLIIDLKNFENFDTIEKYKIFVENNMTKKYNKKLKI